MRPGQVQMRGTAEPGLADGRVAVVEVAIPADEAERRAGPVLARLGPAGEAGDVIPGPACARLDVHGQAERMLAEVRVADGSVALGDPHAVAANEVEHVGQDPAVHECPALTRERHPPAAAGHPADAPDEAGRSIVDALAAERER